MITNLNIVVDEEVSKKNEVGVIRKVGDKWRILKKNRKDYWDAEFDTKKAAQSALRAYWANKNEAVFTISDDDYEYEDDVEEIKSRLIKDNKLTLGGYTWTRIGRLRDHDLYLCDDIVKRMTFSNNRRYYKWDDSDIRKWLNNDFYNKLSDDEKEIIVKDSFLNDNIFLLSKGEYRDFRNNIPSIRTWWWLRSTGDFSESAAYIGDNGVIYNCRVDVTCVGVRPALLV